MRTSRLFFRIHAARHTPLDKLEEDLRHSENEDHCPSEVVTDSSIFMPC